MKAQNFSDVLDAIRGPSDGYCEVLSPTKVEGWAYDRANPGEPVVMRVLLDGNFISLVTCNLVRHAFTEDGYDARKIGFCFDVPADLRDGGDHVIEFQNGGGEPISLRDPTGDHQRWVLPKPISAPSRTVQPSVILGVLDPIQENEVCGWVYDPAESDVAVVLDVLVGGIFQSSVRCDVARADVAAAGHPTSIVGFRTKVPSRYFDGQHHLLEVRPQKGDPRPFETNDGPGAPRRVFKFPAQVMVSQVDGLRNGAMRGWVFAHDRATDTKRGGLQVLVMMQGHPIAQVTACDVRADVAAVYGCDSNCGFTFYPPPKFVAGKTVEFDFRVIPGGHTLVGSPVRANFPSLETAAAIFELQEATEKIFTDLWLLRDRLRRMAPAETYTVEHYDPLARQYQKALAVAPDRLEGLLPAGTRPPLVSIICPVHKPRLPDFSAAVRSVLAQTYGNWELILVDDASKSAELSACIADFARRDKRIKALTLKQNEGISGATNAAIARAKGQWVALFDHDDLMEARAIEFMLAAALRTGAWMLYSDEDKIDDDGTFSEVNLKPDWNYRLLLAQNYVCHLLMVERTQLRKAGAFRSECDGAQDHDIILRLAEVIPSDKIVHVPEVLYHWRKTPASTAASGQAKTYTVDAGIRAIQDHLDRKGLTGRVHSPRAITCFEIDWILPREPSVTIIIPYREHIDMTRDCVDALRAHTDYANYRIILVDNWSTSDEALAFATEIKDRKDVTIMRIQEPFNFSRLNNLAVARSDSELLLFMNNDVFVSDPAWLRVMVGEMLADPLVGIVGNKLLYPSGLVQHGGVVLGVGGIADHAHKGLAADDPGYAARAICAQEMSAVTAACMLCRRTAFDAVEGFDERELQVAFNDTDLCLKVQQAGFRVIWTPQSVAEHRESLSRGDDMRPDQQARFFHENETMMARWKRAISADRFYHRAFSRQSGMFRDLGLALSADIDAEQRSHVS